MIKITPTKDYRLLTQLNEPVQQLHAEMYPKVFKPFNKEIEARIKEMLSDTNAHAYVAYKEEEPIGYILCFVKVFPENPFQYERKLLYIDQIQVNPKCRNLGVGKKLLDCAIELAQEKKITTIQLDHWTNNEFARGFFGKNGFKYYNERMELILDSQ